MNEFNFFIDSQNLVKLNKKKSNQLNLNQVGIWSNTKQDSWKIKTSGYVCRSMMAPTKRREKTFAALESPNDKFHFSPTRSPHHHYQTECCVLVLKKYIKIWTITTEKFSIRNVHSNGFFWHLIISRENLFNFLLSLWMSISEEENLFVRKVEIKILKCKVERS